jgi:hypothetical protein
MSAVDVRHVNCIEEDDDNDEDDASAVALDRRQAAELAWHLYRVRSAASLLSSLASGGSYSLAGAKSAMFGGHHSGARIGDREGGLGERGPGVVISEVVLDSE